MCQSSRQRSHQPRAGRKAISRNETSRARCRAHLQGNRPLPPGHRPLTRNVAHTPARGPLSRKAASRPSEDHSQGTRLTPVRGHLQGMRLTPVRGPLLRGPLTRNASHARQRPLTRKAPHYPSEGPYSEGHLQGTRANRAAARTPRTTKALRVPTTEPIYKERGLIRPPEGAPTRKVGSYACWRADLPGSWRSGRSAPPRRDALASVSAGGRSVGGIARTANGAVGQDPPPRSSPRFGTARAVGPPDHQ